MVQFGDLQPGWSLVCMSAVVEHIFELGLRVEAGDAAPEEVVEYVLVEGATGL